MFESSNATTPNKPIWHAPWKLSRVIRVDEDWVRCIAVDQRNEWFATGSIGNIKIWDLYSGELKLSLTGDRYISGLAVGNHYSYLFSCGEDKQIKCWDLEYNKVVRHYDGNLWAVFGLNFHDKLDLLVSGGSDGTVRLWDVRTKVQTHCLGGHKYVVTQVRCRASEPHIISSSYNTISFWDIVAGKERITLTNPSKYAFRSFVLHPNLNMMVTASVEDLKQWSIPDGVFIQNICVPDGIRLAINTDDFFVSGHKNGDLFFFDWSSGHNFQRLRSELQPDSFSSAISAMTFDKTDSRLITCGMDNTIKVYVEDQNAIEEN